jgi:septal ring factor EnvC (AmiA/AmiB activator)
VSLQELEAVRGGEAARLRELSAEQRELRSELEAVHSEQARRLARAHHEQQELEARLAVYLLHMKQLVWGCWMWLTVQ